MEHHDCSTTCRSAAGKMFGSSMSRLADMVVGGWRLSSIFTWQTGPYETPYFPSGQGDPSGTGSGLNSTATGFDPGHRHQQPDRASGVSMNPSDRTRLNWYNTGRVHLPWLFRAGQPGTPCTTGSGAGPVPLPIGRFGNAQVGSARGPGLVNLSSGLSKSFAITERFRVRAGGNVHQRAEPHQPGRSEY